MKKKFKIPPEAMRPLAVGLGSCIASDRITVDGQPIGFMYREAPDNSLDSGWRFFSGDETVEYTEQAGNFEMYDVNTIANYDPAIVPLLQSGPRSAFERDPATGQFSSVPFSQAE